MTAPNPLRAIARILMLVTIAGIALADDRYVPEPYSTITHPAWSVNASIYQINLRQFTEQGTFDAAREHLPRLKDLGVDILWLMPIHPIGEENRKGSLGSPYSVRDYYGVNRELGTEDDLREFIAAAHEQGFYVILDWVANHTAWDNPLSKTHPDWYDRDWDGSFRPTPWWDWSDIIDLDYSRPEVRRYMTDALKYWVREFDIDGYRCDVAGMVPLDFWNNVRAELDAIKPVFMLAEWEARDLHAKAFDMTYAWSWYDTLIEIVHGRADVSKLFVYYSWNESAWPEDAYRMTFVSNHDKNAWDATEFDAFGEALEPVVVLAFTGEGMPLIYNGQEAGNRKQLAFFEKDPIEWREHRMGALYTRLLELRRANTALWNGKAGARMLRVWNTAPQQVFSFVRENEHDKVFVVLNLSDEEQAVGFSDAPFAGRYVEYFSNSDIDIDPDTKLTLAPWDYRVFVRALEEGP